MTPPWTSHAVRHVYVEAWDAKWEEDIRESSWRNLVDYAVRTGAKVFVGTDITCDEASDDRSWAWAKALMKMLHPDHVMGLAIGRDWAGRCTCPHERTRARTWERRQT